MAFAMVDTPRTEAADMTRLTVADQLDFSTENSIPSPSKDGNNLVKQMRALRKPTDTKTPRSRIPFTDRRNLPTQKEFTPLLKSATRNRLQNSGNQALDQSQLKTPIGLRDSYNGGGSPALPFNSSVIIEEETGSSADNENGQGTPVPPVSSSSALSTPMTLLPRRGNDPLDNGRNLATLREQEARLEQIDKENFSLKLKIHFMEEALRKNGKDFNEAAIRENTELKVDKVTLQRDLKHHRKQLNQAEKDLEEYRRQLLEYAEKVKQRHANEGMQEELDALKRLVEQRDREIQSLKERLEKFDEKDEQIRSLQDEANDLEADLRDRDRQLDEKDEKIEDLQAKLNSGEEKDAEVNDLQAEINELRNDLQDRDNHILVKQDELDRLSKTPGDTDSLQDTIRALRKELQERDEDIEGLHEAMRSADKDFNRRLTEKNRSLEEKDDELHELEDQMKENGHDQSFNLRSKDRELDELKDKISDLAQELETSRADAAEVEDIKKQLRDTETELSAEIRKKSRTIEEKDFEIHALEKKLDSVDDHDTNVEKLQDEIADLEAAVREKQRIMDDRDDNIDNLKEEVQRLQNESDDELMTAQDRIRELEIQEERNLKDLQALREARFESSPGRDQALDSAQRQVKELQEERNLAEETERQLQRDIIRLKSDRDQLERDLDTKDAERKNLQQAYDAQIQALQAAKINAEAESASLQRSIDKLHEAEGTLSSRETQLKQSLDDEKSRREFLQKQMADATHGSERLQSTVNKLRSELDEVRQHLRDTQSREQALQERANGLDDEVQVLQIAQEEETARTEQDLTAVRKQSENLHRQVVGLQQDLARAEKENINARAELDAVQSSRRAIPSPGASHQSAEPEKLVRELRDQLSEIKQQKLELQRQLVDMQNARISVQQDVDTLHFDLEASSDSRSQMLQQLREAQTQLARVKKERTMAQDSLSSMSAEYQALQTSFNYLESNHDTAEKQAQDLRTQLKIMQREADRKLETQIRSYENDIANLEQDLADAQSNEQSLRTKNESAEVQITRLRSRMSNLEADLASLNRCGIPDKKGKQPSDTSIDERKDLHKMLKDAKLESEDLALQITDRDARIEASSAREADLTRQLKRIREERAQQTQRLDHHSKDLAQLRNDHEIVLDELDRLRIKAPASQDKAVLEKRHKSELLGLAKQIEYLSARCKRSETFRQDLAYAKAYFAKVVQTHAQFTEADLRIVGAMGVPVKKLIAEEKSISGGRDAMAMCRNTKRGKDARRQRVATPKLKEVAIAVMACLKMRKEAHKWKQIRKSHDGLLKKLQGMRKERSLAVADSKDDVRTRSRKGEWVVNSKHRNSRGLR